MKNTPMKTLKYSETAMKFANSVLPFMMRPPASNHLDEVRDSIAANVKVSMVLNTQIMNLTEATFQELFVLKSCIEEKIETLQSKKERAEAYLKPDLDNDDDSASEVLTEIISLVNEELEPLQIWLVQVMNAMKIVSNRETIQSN